jgi:putative oxidoreductase
MSTAGTVISVVLGLAFLAAGGSKLANLGPHEQEFVRYDLPGPPPQLTRVLVGSVELIAAALLAIAAIASSSSVAIIGAIVVIFAMTGALATHLRLRDSAAQMAPAAMLGILAVVLVVVA